MNKYFAIALVLVVAITAASFLFPTGFGDKSADLTITVPGGPAVQLKMTGKQVDFFEVFDVLFEKKDARLAAQGILASKYGFYDVKGDAITEGIRNQKQGFEKLSQALDKMLAAHQGPFAKKEGFYFRDVSKIATVNELGMLFGTSHPVAKRIRDICLRQEGICKSHGEKVLMHAVNSVNKGSGAICKQSNYHGLTVTLMNPHDYGKGIVIKLRNHIGACIEDAEKGYTKDNFLHISHADREVLFDNVAGDGPFEAIMFVSAIGNEPVAEVPESAGFITPAGCSDTEGLTVKTVYVGGSN